MKYVFHVAFITLIVIGWLADSVDYPNIALLVWTGALVAVSIMLYRLREQNRAWYGALEFVIAIVGFFMLLKALHDNYHGAADAPTIVRMGLLFAAIYVMVRALDNISAGLRGTNTQSLWDSFLKLGS
jgi:hypothetical protein